MTREFEAFLNQYFPDLKNFQKNAGEGQKSNKTARFTAQIAVLLF